MSYWPTFVRIWKTVWYLIWADWPPPPPPKKKKKKKKKKNTWILLCKLPENKKKLSKFTWYATLITHKWGIKMFGIKWSLRFYQNLVNRTPHIWAIIEVVNYFLWGASDKHHFWFKKIDSFRYQYLGMSPQQNDKPSIIWDFIEILV